MGDVLKSQTTSSVSANSVPGALSAFAEPCHPLSVPTALQAPASQRIMGIQAKKKKKKKIPTTALKIACVYFLLNWEAFPSFFKSVSSSMLSHPIFIFFSESAKCFNSLKGLEGGGLGGQFAPGLAQACRCVASVLMRGLLN